MQPGIYRITCIADGRYYIGQSVNVERRFREHFVCLRAKRHGNPILQAAWDKYGEEHFVTEVLLDCSVEELDREEQKLLDEHCGKELCMNIATCAEAPRRGRKCKPWTEEQRQHLSEIRKGRVVSPETRVKISESHKGLRHSSESIAKMSAAKKDKANTSKQKEKISASLGSAIKAIDLKTGEELTFVSLRAAAKVLPLNQWKIRNVLLDLVSDETKQSYGWTFTYL